LHKNTLPIPSLHIYPELPCCDDNVYFWITNENNGCYEDPEGDAMFFAVTPGNGEQFQTRAIKMFGPGCLQFNPIVFKYDANDAIACQQNIPKIFNVRVGVGDISVFNQNPLKAKVMDIQLGLETQNCNPGGQQGFPPDWGVGEVPNQGWSNTDPNDVPGGTAGGDEEERCGNGNCDVIFGENVHTCSQDCVCGDGICDDVEAAATPGDWEFCEDDCTYGFWS